MGILGIDIGGSGIKGAVVDVETGQLLTERVRLPTPEGANPEEVAEVVKKVFQRMDYHGPIGCGFPAIVQNGIAQSAANVDLRWIGTNINDLLKNETDCPVFTVNDADAAGIAEMRFGAGKELKKGVGLIITLGTGIGTAVFTDGVLLPNTEFGHIEIRGKDAEERTSDAARQRKSLSWEQYAKRLQEFLTSLEKLISPDLIIIGGGISKNSVQYFPYLQTRARLVPAEFLNQAGIVGAALYASEQVK